MDHQMEIDKYNDLLEAYKKALMHSNVTSRRAAMTLAVEMPSKRFWMTADRLRAVLSCIRRGVIRLDGKDCKTEMYRELLSRYNSMSVTKPFCFMRQMDLLEHIVHTPAPKFYMSPTSALRLYYNMKKRKKVKRNGQE